MDDEEAQEILKEVEGIGTEATRANIIENLKQRYYIEVTKNEITVTAKGITLCKAVAQEPLLTSAEMTAQWEGYLKRSVTMRAHPKSFSKYQKIHPSFTRIRAKTTDFSRFI